MAALGTGALVALPYCWLLLRSAGRIRTTRNVPATGTALVLGAGVRRDGTPSLILRGRLEVAQDLLESGKVRRIVVSGSPRSRGHSEPVVMRDHLVSRGVPAELVLLDESGVDTWCSCRHAAEDLGLREVTVVTTGFHLRRAVALCRRTGMETWGVGHDARAAGLRRVAARGARREALAVVKAFWWRHHP
ncbi:YdcF family protein [Saccharopolyspora sp. HNM0983]|uniref:YdcF family protein n=1 Tax=Saccharopolyspora montiporae TaxID=2781240 RepID=A0A929G0R1_9PSEU|nr:YdcF family protein [Saccharopolyspora sp. HNM0983]